jgi:hypothetical protein
MEAGLNPGAAGAPMGWRGDLRCAGDQGASPDSTPAARLAVTGL